ncbi:MAG: GNAT family N-acetyltransferase [Candidatus Saccharibacteria bacterium]|nr:GNAT family N-acetyltransferase [Candidatus Saccharibacteria bacterium]
MDRLKLEFPTLARKEDAIEYIKEFDADGSRLDGTNRLKQYIDDYSSWIKRLDEDLKREPNEDRVPAETYFLVRESDNRIVGMINIRLTLNHNLWNFGGHIGYSIRPSERRKGYNKINLYLALCICERRGIEVVLLDCAKDNLGSSKTMRALGGKMIYEYFDSKENTIVQNYVIDVKTSLETYRVHFSGLIAEYPE